MAGVEVEVKGLGELQKKLGRAASREVLARGIDECTKDVQALIAAYPAEGEGNRPRPRGKWWQRHKGWRWNTRAGIRGTDTSEKLQKSWKREMRGAEGRVFTGVSYANLVQGPEQTSFHKAHGWETAEQVVEKYKGKAAERLAEHVRRALGR
jgi:hypothetical protein